jgi:lipopolysaccharide export system permease protein
MRRITRYVLVEFLKLFIVTVGCLTIMIVLGVVAQEASRRGLGPAAILKLIPYAMPIAMLYSVPASMLFAACSIYGRMSASNEITAIKSLGVSPLTVLWPALLLSSVVSAGVVWLNDFAVSWGRVGVNRVVLESAEQIAYGMLRSSRSYSTSRIKINVKDVQGHKLVRPTLTVYQSPQDPPIHFTAKEAELHTDIEGEALIVSLTDGEIQRGDDLSMEFNDTQTIAIPLSSASDESGRRRPSDTPLRHIPTAIKDQRGKIQQLEQSLAAEAAYQMMTGDFAELTGDRWQAEHARLDTAHGTLFRLHTEPWRRWANGFSCLAFVIVGAPLAVRLRNADVWTSFLLCFLPTLVLYYPLLAYGVDLAKSGDLPPYCVWIGNVVFVVIGYSMIRKVLRY